MNNISRISIKWGLLIGLANLCWLYLAYYFGLHTNGILIFQLFMLVWLIISISGYIMALRAVKHQNPQLGYLRGVVAGMQMALASAIMAVIAQVGYFKVINPAWPDTMAQQTRQHFEARGLSPVDVEQLVIQARSSFTLSNYAVSSAITAVVVGIVLAAIIMIFIRHRKIKKEDKDIA